MKKLRILRSVLVRTHAAGILCSYLVFVFVDAMVIFLADPAITTYGDALWYCYAVISTAGFGDLTATVFISRAASVLLTVYSILVIALVTGVIVNYYNQLIQVKQKETLSSFADRMQRLPELSKEELEEMAENARRIFEDNNILGESDGNKKEE